MYWTIWLGLMPWNLCYHSLLKNLCFLPLWHYIFFKKKKTQKHKLSACPSHVSCQNQVFNPSSSDSRASGLSITLNHTLATTTGMLTILSLQPPSSIITILNLRPPKLHHTHSQPPAPKLHHNHSQPPAPKLHHNHSQPPAPQAPS